MTRRPVVGVMGSAGNVDATGSPEEITSLIENLVSSFVANECVLLTGETSGIPGQLITAAKSAGVLTIGVSPAHSESEQKERYQVPPTRSDVVIYTGFGYKGRNVINIRASDIVLVFSGSMGTLNEFTIAFDESKVIGILEGTGGVADQVRSLVEILNKKTRAEIIYERDPAVLLERCLEVWQRRSEGVPAQEGR